MASKAIPVILEKVEDGDRLEGTVESTWIDIQRRSRMVLVRIPLNMMRMMSNMDADDEQQEQAHRAMEKGKGGGKGREVCGGKRSREGH